MVLKLPSLVGKTGFGTFFQANHFILVIFERYMYFFENKFEKKLEKDGLFIYVQENIQYILV